MPLRAMKSLFVIRVLPFLRTNVRPSETTLCPKISSGTRGTCSLCWRSRVLLVGAVLSARSFHTTSFTNFKIPCEVYLLLPNDLKSLQLVSLQHKQTNKKITIKVAQSIFFPCLSWHFEPKAPLMWVFDQFSLHSSSRDLYTFFFCLHGILRSLRAITKHFPCNLGVLLFF